MTGRGVVVVLSTMAILSCSPSDRGGDPWHDEQPRLRITVALPPGVAIATATALAAPAVRFDALVQPDPNHVLQITAPTSGTIVQIRADSIVYRGDTLALVENKADGSADRASVVATHDGTWRTSRHVGQFAWEDELLGLLEQRGYLLAVGAVTDLESRLIHVGDPARVERDGGLPILSGRVEQVRQPRATYIYSVEVAVEFSVPRSVPHRWRDVTVVVTPADPQDSLAAVPATAIVQLLPRSAVFIPVGIDQYDVVWVSTGPAANKGHIAITDGVRPGMKVVASAIAAPALAQAARDSLARRAQAR